MPRRDTHHLQDLWSLPGRKGIGMRWRLRLSNLPGHEGTVTELFADLAAAQVRRDELLAARKREHIRPEAGQVRLSDITNRYLGYLRAVDPPTEHYLRSVEFVLDRAIESNLDDVRQANWAQGVTRWLDGLTVERHCQKVPAQAKAATKRMYRTILGGAMNFAVRNLQWLERNPLLALTPRRSKAARMARSKDETDTRKIIPLPILRGLVADEAKWEIDPRHESALKATTTHGSVEAAAKALNLHPSTLYYRRQRHVRREDPRWILAALLTYTGMRLGQAIGLLWSDIDLANSTIRLRAEVRGNRSGHETTVEIEPELKVILDARPRSGLWVVPDPTSSTGRLMRRAWLHESFDRWLAAHGCVGQTAHNFRHSYVCMLTAMSISTLDIKRRVNHMDISMTARYADHLIAIYRAECSGWGTAMRLRQKPAQVEAQSRRKK